MKSVIEFFGTFMIILISLLVWSWYICPYMNRMLNQYRILLKEWQETKSEHRKMNDEESKIGDLEKWY